MLEEDKPGFLYHFDTLDDPRIDRKKLYPLTEVLFVVICASICGAQSWRDFVTFGEEKLDYLRRFLPFENGIPSKNTYARVFSILNPDEFKKCFISWIQSFQQALGNLIAIDGKTLRKSFDKANQQSAIHNFISSLAANAKQIAEAIRSHWAVQNSLHWVLDVTLREDDSRVRKDHAPENMAMVRHIILNMLQNTKKKFKDMTIRRLQKKAGWGDSTLDMILMAAF